MMRRLKPGADGQVERERSHHRFAGAHVTLKQSLHRMRRAHVGDDLADGALLVARECERQRFQKLPFRRPRRQVLMRL